MPRSYGDYAAAFVAALLVLYILIFSITMNSTTSVSAVEARGVGVYEDSDCSIPKDWIDWGTLYPGSVTSEEVYIRNEDDENKSMYLILWTENWDPLNASDFLELTWNYTLVVLAPEDVVPIELTLSCSEKVEDIDAFSFDILVAGSDSLPGDVDSDGKVDWKDLRAVCLAYGSYPGHAKWNPNCDFNCNNKVDWEDLSWLCRNFGKTD